MAWLTRAHQVRRIVKNAGRMREIATAMSRFGFGAFVERVGLKSYKTEADSEDQAHQPLPVRLRLMMEQLGPTFIKAGQILAGRPDLVSPEFIEEFKKLQDRVAPVPFSLLKPILEEQLGRPLEACFSSLDPEPLANASIAQVHTGRTLDGEEVVVKVRKPDVEKLLHQDLEILETLAQLAEHYIPELRPLQPRFLAAEFKRAVLTEIHFTLEANNVKRFRENFAESSFLVIPKVYSDLSTTQVLTMERLRGVKLSDVDAVRGMGVDTRELLQKGMDCFFQSMLKDGFFHGDPHGGNILVLPDGRMGLIDFGLVGRLSDKAKDSLVGMFVALLAQDYDMLVLEYMNLNSDATTSRSSNVVNALQREVSDVFSPYFGLPIKDIPMGTLLMQASGIAMKHRISIPRDLILVFKAIMTLEGIGRSLDPDFDLVSSASKYVKLLIRERYAPKRLLKDALFIGRDWIRFIEKAPRQLGEAFRQLENGDLKAQIQISNLDVSAKATLQGFSRISMSILATGVLIVAAMVSRPDNGVHLWLRSGLWGWGAFLAFIAFWKSVR